MYCITLRSRTDARITGWYDGSDSRWSTDHNRHKLFDKKADEMRAAGYKLEMLAINANGHYVYVDTRKDTGHHTELLWFSEAGVAFLAKIPYNPN